MTANGKTVLLVEDNEDNRIVYSTILRHFGYSVTEALNGEEGIAKARAENDGEVEYVAAGQKRAHRVGLVELLGREPLPLFDHHAARPRQHAAEARQRNRGEGDEQLRQARRLARPLGGGAR